MQYVCFLMQCDCNYKLAASKMSINQGKKEGGTEVQTATDVQSQLCTQSQCSCDSWYWVKQTHLDFIICSLAMQPGFKRDVDCQAFSIILSFTPCQVTVLSIPAIVKTCIAVRSEEFPNRRNEKSCHCCLKPWSETACKKVNRRTLTQVGRRRRTAFLDKGTNFAPSQLLLCRLAVLCVSGFVMSYISLNDPTLTSWMGTHFLLLWRRQ